MTRALPAPAIREGVTAQLRRVRSDKALFAAALEHHSRALGVSKRTLYRWVAAEPSALPKRGRPGLEVSTEHLTVLAACQDAKSAWRMLGGESAGFSYSTFMRALANCDPARVQGALHGHAESCKYRVYREVISPHRGHTLHIDHTPADLRVRSDHRSRQVMRPILTVSVDAYSGYVHATLWPTHSVNSGQVAAFLGELACPHSEHGIDLGGIPEQVVMDNGGENLAAITEDAVAALGWIVRPTTPYTPQQNGKAERMVLEVNRRLSSRAPGAMHIGKDRQHKARFLPASLKDTDPDSLWTLAQAQKALREVVTELNTTVPMRRLGGRTRAQAWADDPTALRFIDEKELWAVMLRPTRARVASTHGIQFDNRHYVAAAVEVGREYSIGYLPTNRAFVEVFDMKGAHVTRAYTSEAMPAAVYNAMRAKHARLNAELAAEEAGMKAQRLAMVRLADLADEDSPDADVPSEDAVPAALPVPARQRAKRPTAAATALRGLYGAQLPQPTKPDEENPPCQ